MATWPTYAKIAFDGFSVRRQAAVVRTEMESGPPKQAQILSKVMVTRDCTVYLTTQSDYASFITWFTSTINRGTDWFTWTDPVDGVSKQARIVGGMLESESPRGGVLDLWAIRMQLETWDA